MTKPNVVLPALATVLMLGGLLLAEQPPGRDSFTEALVKSSLLAQNGNYLEAEEVLKPALRAGGESVNSERMAVALTTLGLVCQGQRRYVEAEKFYKRALQIGETRSQAKTEWEMIAVFNLARIYYYTGRFSQSQKFVYPYLALWRERGGNSLGVAVFLHALGAAYEGQGRYADAQSTLQESLGILRRQKGQDAHLADLLLTYGRLQTTVQDYTGAHQSLDETLAILGRLQGDRHLVTVRPLLALAMLHVRTGEIEEAEHYINRALATALESVGTEHPLTGEILFQKATILRGLKRKVEARRAEQQAKAILEKTPAENPSRYTVDVSELSSARGDKP